MTRSLLSSLRSRARQLLPGASGNSAPPLGLDVLQQLSVTGHVPGLAAPRFGAMFAAAPHRSAAPQAALDSAIRARAQHFAQSQPDYQPVYGFTGEFPAKRAAHLERNVTLVQTLLKDVSYRHQPRILDVGCNMGYVAMRIAETYPNVVGLEISREHLELCRLLAARSGSPARFFDDDALDLLRSGQDDLENVDVVLLYNVVHQFIFHHGLQATKGLLARLASRVDTVIAELALQRDYVRHGKDQLLPADPAEVLSDCVDCEITLLHEKPRPVYRIRRKTVRVGALSIVPEAVSYSANPDPLVSRKYYAGSDHFLKLYRFCRAGDRDFFDREVEALLKLRDTGVAPRLHDWCADAGSGALLMSRVVGERLISRLHGGDPAPTTGQRMRLTREYLRVARTVHNAVGFQNDLQAHNLIWTKGVNLVVVDFEQAGATPTNDPFGLLLWTVFLIWGGRDKERPAAIRSLRLAPAGPDAGAEPPRIYPDFGPVQLPPKVAALVEAAAAGGDWGAFLDTWAERLAPPPAAGPSSG